MNWRPIETAPKDYTKVLAYDPQICHHIVAYQDDEGVWLNDWKNGEFYPTHWMPLPPPPSTEPAPQDTGEDAELKRGWVPLQEVLDVLYHPDFYWGLGGLSDVKYLDLRIDTRDNHCQVKNRNGKPVNIEHVRSCIAKAWMKGMNENAAPSGHDLSQVVVLDKAVFNEVGRVLADVAENSSGRFAIQAADALASLNV